jgi:hypothetical protein
MRGNDNCAARHRHSVRVRPLKSTTARDLAALQLAPLLYEDLAMSADRRNASSYDEIVRRTVPQPDSSFRSTIDEEHLSRHRAGKQADHVAHEPTDQERTTLAKVRDTLEADRAIDLTNVKLSMDGRELVIKGNVPGPATSARIEDVAGRIDGVDRIDNQLAIRGE